MRGSKEVIYIDLKDMAKFIKEEGVDKLLESLVHYLEEDYRKWDEFTKIPRPTHHSKYGVNELMPIGDQDLFAVKYVNGHPVNPSKDLMTVIGLGILADVETGYPLMFSEMTLLTALRTAANSAMAARHLARKDSKKMALIGNGAQSEFQAIAFHKLLGIEEISCYDIDDRATDKLMANLSEFKDLSLKKCSSVAQAVKGADIVTTVTADKKFATILSPEMIEEGMHLNCVGGDCPGKTELDSKILYMGRVFVEFEEQSRIEGEIQHMPADFKVTEIAEIIKAGSFERNDSDITIFDSVGFAIEDHAVLRMVYDLAKEKNIGTREVLVPSMEDPKDLFGLLR